MIYKRLIFSCFLALLFVTKGNSQITIESLLNSAVTDPSMTIKDVQLDFLDENKFRSPLLHRFEFRTRSNDFSLDQEDFRFRLAPVNPWERKANRKYYDQQLATLDLEYQLKFSKALKSRYNLIIDYLKLKALKENEQKELSILNDQTKVFLGKEDEDIIKVKELIDLEEKYLTKELNILAIDRDVTQLHQEFERLTGITGAITVDDENLVNINTVAVRINEEVDYMLNQNADIKFRESEQMLESTMLEVKKAKNKRNIGYIQAEYDTDRGNEFDEHFGYQIGIRLPISNPDKPDMQRDQFEWITEEKELEIRKQVLDYQLNARLLDIEESLEQYNLINSRRAQWNGKINRILPLEQMDPAALLEAELYATKLEKKLIDLQFVILEEYIEILEITGLLTQAPLVNYLDQNLKPF